MKQAEDRGINLFAEYKKIQNYTIVCDEARIKQVLMGLQSNAIKFTERGFIKITVEIFREKQKQFLQISV